MEIFRTKLKSQKTILALGAESAGNFSVFQKGTVYFSENFGDLLEEKNFRRFQKAVRDFLKEKKIKPDVVLTDLHPFFATTRWGRKLSRKFRAKHILIQHHLAHVFSAVGDRFISSRSYSLPAEFYGLAGDGTGLGTDGKIWGGEVFRIEISKFKIKKILRVGRLENQMLLGGDLAVREPARMLVSVLEKILPAEKTYSFVKKYYAPGEFTVLRGQLKQKFNCRETSSAGRILDAVSLLLGFCRNERKYKHEPVDLLEKNSTRPYPITPRIIYADEEKKYILFTTPLFEYLVKNIRRDKKRLAATAQNYLAKGLWEIVKKQAGDIESPVAFMGGGMANNKIISRYLKRKNVYFGQKIPRGDAGISFGQIIFHELSSWKD